MKPWWMTLALSAVLIACSGPKKTGGGDTEDTNTEDTDTDDVVEQDDGTFATANSVAINEEQGGVYIEDEIGFAGDRDFFKVELVENQPYYLFASTELGEGNPDTVIRVYAPDETLIGENDDLPYRLHGTDAGYAFVAPADGEYYVEVLEWSDWADDSPAGDPAWAYGLIIGLNGAGDLNEDADADVDNDSVEDAVANLDADEAADTDDAYGVSLNYYASPWTNNDDDTYGYAFWMNGAIDSAGDVDYFGVRFEADDFDGPGIVEFSSFPGTESALNLQVDLLDGEGNELLTDVGDEFEPTPVGTTDDVGFAFLVTEPGDYLLRVADSSGEGGADHWYALIGNIYSLNMDVITYHEIALGQESTPANAAPLVMTEGTGAEFAYNYGFVFGKFEEANDPWDSFEIEGAEAGQFFSLQLGTQSLASDVNATIRLYDGSEEIASAETNPEYTLLDDPGIYDFELPEGVGGTLYLVIENEDDVDGSAAYYQGIVYLADEEIYTF